MTFVLLSISSLHAGNRFMSVRQSEIDYGAGKGLREMFGSQQPNDYFVYKGDTLRFDLDWYKVGRPLSEADYRRVAADLKVEVAAIKAIVDVETGRTRRGFNADSTPIVFFDLKVFRTMASRRKINLSAYTVSHAMIFESPDAKRFGSQQKAHHQCLRTAMSIDTLAAIEGTFWGMFQIGGFNWKRCGAKSPRDFAERMSRTERDQLELFAGFMRNSGLLPYLQSKNWTAFARGYNGPTYVAQGYHTKLEAAYRRHSRS